MVEVLIFVCLCEVVFGNLVGPIHMICQQGFGGYGMVIDQAGAPIADEGRFRGGSLVNHF